MLKFSQANAKTKKLRKVEKLQRFLGKGRKVYSFDLPAGHTCPGAMRCLSKVVDGKIKDGPHCHFRCFSASQEALFPKVSASRQHNLAELRKCRGWRQYYDILNDSLPNDCGILRYHVSGDWFNRSYLRGAVTLAEDKPDTLFYGYTKSLHLLGGLTFPDNFRLTLSRGGKHESLIDTLNLREAVVVFSEDEANGLPIDHDDSHAALPGPSFALLLHGVQPAGSTAAKALQKLRGKGSYGRK